jgi:hypothetical protein
MSQLLLEMGYVVYTLCVQAAQACSFSVGVPKTFETQRWRRARSHSKRLELPDEWGGNWMAGEVNQSKSCDCDVL